MNSEATEALKQIDEAVQRLTKAMQQQPVQRTARARISHLLLAQILCLPKGVCIRMVEQSPEDASREQFSVLLEGDGLLAEFETPPGTMSSEATIFYKRTVRDQAAVVELESIQKYP